MFYHKQTQKAGNSMSAILLVVMIFIIFGAHLWRQDIQDWLRLKDYQPPIEIQQLAFDTTMTNSARRLFYVYHPQLDDREEFNKNCSGFGEHTIVLGCYIENTGIFLFDIDDQRLDGVEQVTAAHEMLHAAYDRLSSQERQKIDKQTADVFEKINDERIINAIDGYRARDPSAIPTELHSILATEVRELPALLEEYYSRYFTNRQTIVSYSEKYEFVLLETRNKAASLEIQIKGLENDIMQMEEALKIESNYLQSRRETINSQKEVDDFNYRVNSYNQNVEIMNRQINKYNNLIDEYKSTALENQELFKALDSRPTM